MKNSLVFRDLLENISVHFHISASTSPCRDAQYIYKNLTYSLRDSVTFSDRSFFLSANSFLDTPIHLLPLQNTLFLLAFVIIVPLLRYSLGNKGLWVAGHILANPKRARLASIHGLWGICTYCPLLSFSLENNSTWVDSHFRPIHIWHNSALFMDYRVQNPQLELADGFSANGVRNRPGLLRV